MNPKGYVQVNFNYKYITAHRLAWLFTYGYIPKMIDHKNEIKHDNRICNLRECTDSENKQNRGIAANNTSGAKGVSWSEERKKYCVSIGINKKSINLGRFDNFEDAVKARKDAEKKYYTFILND